jgi:hypothetical protein
MDPKKLYNSLIKNTGGVSSIANNYIRNTYGIDLLTRRFTKPECKKFCELLSFDESLALVGFKDKSVEIVSSQEAENIESRIASKNRRQDTYVILREVDAMTA